MDPFPHDSKAAELLSTIRREIPAIGLTPETAGLREAVLALDRLTHEDLLGKRVADADMATCVRSGLLLRADLLAESHTLSQSVATAEGSYWHGIMHRREPDFSNAKYWFRRVGRHDVFADLARESARTPIAGEVTTAAGWDPFRYIDACEACYRGRRPELLDALLALQEREIELLLAYCCQRATRP